ncbi:MAG: aspartyl protease family protein [Acidobacteriota bacterium]|nr:aspartyl protease family protein [Acidobacteriota bacterium]
MGRARNNGALRGAFVSSLLIGLTIWAWAVSGDGATAHALFRQREPLVFARLRETVRQNRASGAVRQNRANAPRVPAPVRFRDVSGRGLVVQAWVNDEGPFDFAVDTGAGSTILSPRVAQAARVAITNGRTVNLSGLSGVRGSAREASVRSIAVGDPGNYLPGRGSIIVADSLPSDLDGVLDPSETFYPLGYAIDFRDELLRAFDPRVEPVSRRDIPADGDVVAWLTDGATRRPFVMLEGGRRALIDTGSGLGLGLPPEAARSLGVVGGRGDGREGGLRDLGRGQVGASRVEPATVRVGALVLRHVPTDLLAGASADAPIILGRDALRPFELTFDPVSRLIRFAPR